jgi:PAS domain S-box-containing protein
MKAPLPLNEAGRLQALRRYQILDPVPEQDFDDLTFLASHICGTPIAMISIVDRQLCVNDRVARELSAGQQTALQALSRLVVAQLELRHGLAQLKRTEEVAQRGQKHLRDLIDGLGASMFVGLLTPQGILIEANQPALAAAGLKPEDVLGKPFEETYWWTWSLEVQQQLRAAITRAARGEPSRYDVQIRAAENLFIDVDFSLQPLRDETGEIVFLIPSGVVITERKRAETALRESEARTRILIKSSDIGLWDWNLVTNEVFFSAEWKGQLGYSDAELPSRFEEWESRLHPDDREPTLAAVQDYRAGRRGDYELDFRLRHKDGSWRWIFARATLTRDAAGRPVRMMGGHIDITERKRNEEALRESEERFAGAFEHAPIGVALVSPEGRWLKVNRAICDLVGYSEAELLTRTFQDITHPEDLEADLENVRRMLAGELHTYQMEKRYVHALGHLVPVLLDVSLVRDGHGQPRYFISQIQDVTGRKLAEAHLAKTHQELLEVSRQAGMAEVATGVLHNVGNVLNSVNVASSCVADTLRKSKTANLSKVVALLREHEASLGAFLTEHPKGKQIPGYLAQLAEHLAAEQAGALQELAGLQKNIEHIKDIVTMQQSFAKVSGTTETLSVDSLVEDALKMNSSALARHDIAVTKDFQSVPLITVEKQKVLQILVNLVRNAKQACDESSAPEKRLTVSVTNGNERVRILVADNGIGILSENLSRIFAHGFTTKKSGHGFGLHSGALAAREMGGSLTVQSNGLNLGSTFTLELPLKSKSNL